MPLPFGNYNENKLSSQLLRWLVDRVPYDDPLRINDFSHYEFVENLGSGRFGNVCKYLNQSTKTHETIKKVDMKLFDHWTQDKNKLSNRLDNFILELRRLYRVSNDNPRIVNFLGLYSNEENLYIMTEYVAKGSVKDRVMNEGLSEETAIRYLQETVEALHYLHTLSPPIVHRDIKAANLLIAGNDRIKLGNFGLVRDLAIDGFGMAVASEITLDFRGTLLYTAPEVLDSHLGPGNRMAYELPADIWALGCTFIEMLLKYPPHFEFFGHVSEIPKVLLGYTREDDGKKLPYTGEVLVPTSSRKVQRIVDAILVKNPEKRPTTKKLKTLIPNIVLTSTISADDPSTTPGTSSTEEELEERVIRPKPMIPRKIGNATSSFPIETIENGVTRRKKKKIKSNKSSNDSHVFTCFLYFSSRLVYFLTILTKSVAHLLLFLLLGIGSLAVFLFLSYLIVKSVRYIIALHCECDLMEPQYLIISGILIVLLFALLFSCCMVALGEYKFRMANKTLRKSRFFISRPEKSAKLCGITVFPGKESKKEWTETDDMQQLQHAQTIGRMNQQNEEYYYNSP